jgi:hypothetical protein
MPIQAFRQEENRMTTFMVYTVDKDNADLNWHTGEAETILLAIREAQRRFTDEGIERFVVAVIEHDIAAELTDGFMSAR